MSGIPSTGFGHCRAHESSRLVLSGAPHIPWSGSWANPQWHRDPSLALALHVTAQGERQADRPLSQPQHTGLFHYQRPPTLCHGLLAAPLAWEGAAGREGRSGHGADVFARCCEQCWGCLAVERGVGSLSILPVSPNRGHGVRDSSPGVSQGTQCACIHH